MGPNLNANDIKEGDDVYFECHIHANPKPYKMAWFHNVSPSAEQLYFSNRHSSTTPGDTHSTGTQQKPNYVDASQSIAGAEFKVVGRPIH